MEMDLNLVWQDFGLDRLQEGILRLFPERRLNLEELLGEVMTGDVFGALAALFRDSITDFFTQLAGMRNVFVWLLVLGISWRSSTGGRWRTWVSILCTCFSPRCC